MKRLITLLFICCLSTNLINAQWLTVGDPQEDWWYYNQGSIEDAEITIHPQGLYLEIGMYLTFSGLGNHYTKDDIIEVECNFDLPEGSIIHDSWLWFNQDTLIADLIDRWTATSIYNAIVGRRQDPSILYQTWGNNYELRIYPMQGDSTRRVKLSYLLPLTFSSNTVFATLPMNIIKLSMKDVENVKFRIQTDDIWKNPRIMEYPDLVFDENESHDYLTNKLLEINSSDYDAAFTLQFDSPMKDGIFVNQLDEEENYYQLAILPSTFINNIEPKNVVVCIDHIDAGGLVEADELLENIKYSIKNGFSPIDSFNIIFSSAATEPILNEWTSVKDVDSVFASFEENPINTNRNLPSLLFSAVKFVNNSSSRGEILLVANTYENGEPQEANILIDSLLQNMGDEVIPIHSANYCRGYYNWYWAGNTHYYGNEYLYINLARLTNANYSKIEYWNQSVSEFIFEFSQTVGGLITSFDLHTSLENGFCYSRFDLNSNDGLIYINKPFLQIGKYYGDLPFKIEVAGLYNNEPFSNSITVDADDFIENDTLLEEAWAGNYIKFLESQSNWYSNEIVREIIDYSIRERVLSRYTAFLAIEPGALDSLDINVEIVDNGGDIVSLIEEEPKLDELEEIKTKAYPNPFLTEISFELKVPSSFIENEIELKIYDVTGKLIVSENIQHNQSSESLVYHWNGRDGQGLEVPKGTYIAIFYTATFKEALKVLKM